MEFFVFGVVIISTIWVYCDASKLQAKGASISPGSWALLTFLLWFAGFPLYCLSAQPRAHLELAEKTRRGRSLAPPAPRASEERFNCPVCGEAIPVAAKMCRFCNAVITANDKPKPASQARAIRKR